MPVQPPNIDTPESGMPDQEAILELYRTEERKILRMLDKATKGEPALSEVGLQPMGGFGDSIETGFGRVLGYLLDFVLDSPIVNQLMDAFLPRSVQVEPPEHLMADEDPGSPRAIARPHELYARLRNKFGDVAWVEAHGAYWVLSPQKVTDVLNDFDQFRQAPSSTKQRGIITLDGARHQVVSKAVVAAIDGSKGNVNQYIDAAVTAALDEIGDLPQFDVISKYTKPVPRRVFWNVFGLPEDQREECTAFAESMMTHFGQPLKRGAGPRAAFTDAMIRLALGIAKVYTLAVIRTLWNPNYMAGTLIGEIARRTEVLGLPSSKRPVTFFEGLATLLQIVLASMSMQFHLGTAVRNLLSPDPRPRLKTQDLPWKQLIDISKNQFADFELMLRNALLESRRVDPPVGIVQRYAGPQGAKIGTLQIPADCPVFAVVASAHAAPLMPIPEPDRFYWDRPGMDNLALGYGLHECVGRGLQGLVVPEALKRLMTAMPDLRLCDPDSVPAWLDNLYFRTLQSLPVRRCL